MRRVWAGSLVALAAALIMAACGGGAGPTPIPPPPPPPVVNTPPVVKSIAVSDTRVEAGAPVTLTATVEDAETPVANLSFSWTIPPGSVTGTGNGSTLTFTPSPELRTPADYEIGVTVTERYTSAGVQAENKATGSVTLHVNNSPRELADMSLRFLGDFANSKVSPDKCVAEFSDSCRGKKAEFDDIDDNRHDYEIIASTLRHTSLTIASSRVSATVHTFCSFTSKVITTQPRDEYCLSHNCALGSIQGPVTGDCITTNVYQNGRWWLCDSSFGPLPGQTLTAFARAFFHVDRHERATRGPIGR
jgi:hypothetical protein